MPKSDVPGEEAWPTQPFPTKPPPFARQSFTEKDINPYITEAEQARMRKEFMTFRNEGIFTPPSRQGSVQMPGNAGGATWGSSAVDPNRGLMFVVSKERPAIIKLNLPGEKSRGQTLGLPPLPGPLVTELGEFPRYDAPYDFMVMTNGLTTIGPPWSQITAYDLNTGTIKWQVPDGGVTALAEQGHPDTGAVSPRGGIVATAGGLLFITTAFRPQIPGVRSGFRARVVGEGAARRSRRRARGLRDRRTRIHRAVRGSRSNQSADSNGWWETRGPGRRLISGLRFAAPVAAQERVSIDSSSNLCGEECFENGDQNASYQAQVGFQDPREDPRTSPSKLFPGTRTLSRFRGGRHRW